MLVILTSILLRVCGSYSDMNAGTPTEALVDFTGGVHMSILLSDRPQNLWELMYRAGKSKSLMGCGTPQGVSTNITHKTTYQLVLFFSPDDHEACLIKASKG